MFTFVGSLTAALQRSPVSDHARPWQATVCFAVSQIDGWVFWLIKSYFTSSGPHLVGYWGAGISKEENPRLPQPAAGR